MAATSPIHELYVLLLGETGDRCDSEALWLRWVFHHTVTRRHATAGERIGSLYRAFKSAAKQAGLPAELHQYDLRHHNGLHPPSERAPPRPSTRVSNEVPRKARVAAKLQKVPKKVPKNSKSRLKRRPKSLQTKEAPTGVEPVMEVLQFCIRLCVDLKCAVTHCH